MVIIVKFIPHLNFVRILCVNLHENEGNYEKTKETTNIRKGAVHFSIGPINFDSHMRFFQIYASILAFKYSRRTILPKQVNNASLVIPDFLKRPNTLISRYAVS